MSGARSPKFVALPEVSQHTDNIVFGGLNLPVGFDDERLLVNIRGFDRIRAAAGLGQVSIFCGPVSENQDSFSIAGIDASGAASLAKAKTKTDSPFGKGTLRMDNQNNEYFGTPDAIVKINAKEVDDHLRKQQTPRNMLDATLRAKVLNRSVRQGLSEAALQVNIDKPRTLQSMKGYGFLASLVVIGGGNGMDISQDAKLFAMGTVFNYLGLARSISEANMIRKVKGDKNKTSMKDAFVNYRHSLFIGDAFDRYLGTKLLLSTTRLIKGRK